MAPAMLSLLTDLVLTSSGESPANFFNYSLIVFYYFKQKNLKSEQSNVFKNFTLQKFGSWFSLSVTLLTFDIRMVENVTQRHAAKLAAQSAPIPSLTSFAVR
jgi:hypothetical protein